MKLLLRFISSTLMFLLTLIDGVHLLSSAGYISNPHVNYPDEDPTTTNTTMTSSNSITTPRNLTEPKGTLLVKLHGTFMVAAWMMLAPCGIILTRFYKLTWVEKQIMGKEIWLVFHGILMMTTWTLTVVAFIFVELGGWTRIPATQNAHAVIGMITTLLAFIQPIMAHFRPHPDAPTRDIFHWTHWTVGRYKFFSSSSS